MKYGFRSRRLLLLLLLAAGALARPVCGQPIPPHPPQGPAPLLYVRFVAPPGVRVTFYQAGAAGREFPAPVAVGLRPGYLYRVKLSSLPNAPGADLYPSLEVRGTLQLPPRLRSADYPAPVVFSADDLERARRGVLVTKVIYLEDPDQAIPVASHPDQPFEADAPPQADPVAEARELGRIMVIVRLGGRGLSPDDLARQSVPGTILLPGMKALAPPAAKPWVPWAGFPMYDPRLGPKPPVEECLSDGGDAGPPAGLDHEGRLRGLDPADTVAEYTDSQHRRHLSVSNRVCLCVPRFAVVRAETALEGYLALLGPGSAQAVQEQFQAQARVPSLLAQRNEQLAAVRGRERPSANLVAVGVDRLVHVEVLNAYDVEIGLGSVLGTNAARQLTAEQRARLVRQVELARLLEQPYGTRTHEQIELGPEAVGRIQGVNVIATRQEARDVTVCCEGPPRPPDKPLVLFKWVDRQSVQVGDVVTFFLKYSNQGGEPITDIAVSDSLTGRLEYIPGSAKTDRDAVLTMQPNEAGSVILRWEVGGRLLPGQSGVVSFQARVR